MKCSFRSGIDLQEEFLVQGCGGPHAIVRVVRLTCEEWSRSKLPGKAGYGSV